MEAKIFANINRGDDDEFSEYTGAGFFGKIFDISSKHLAAESVSKATLGEKKAWVPILLQTSNRRLWFTRR